MADQRVFYVRVTVTPPDNATEEDWRDIIEDVNNLVDEEGNYEMEVPAGWYKCEMSRLQTGPMGDVRNA